MRITSLSPLVALALAACGVPDSPALELGPADATTTDDLTLTLTAPSDADAEDHYEIAWTRDGEAVPDYDNAEVVPASVTAKGQVWVATVTPVNKRDRAGVSVSAEITVVNTPPTATVAVADDIALTTEDLVATATSDDVDGDEVALTWTWLRDGEKTGYTGDTVPAADTAKGEVWTVVVSPADDEVAGEDVQAVVSIDNSFPVADSVTLSPAAPAVTDAVVASAEGHDEDGDALTWTYAWTVDGEPVDGVDGPELPAGSFAKGQVVAVVAIPNDGYVDGESATAQVTAVNSAPSLESASIDPSVIREADTASCVPAGWSDVDGDAAGYALSWRVNGSEVSAEGTLSGGSFDKGDSIVCVVTPDDGEATGEPVASAAVVVSNTAPVLAGLSLDSSAPKTGDDLTVSVTGVSDVDGDSVSYSYVWSVNGSAVVTDGTAATSSTLGSSYYAKGDTVSVSVTPDDGDDAGAAVASSTVTVANTAPAVGSVALDLAAPATDDVITASAAGVDDVDGDSVTLTWSWSVNGSVVATETGSTSSLDGATYFSSGDVVSVSVVPGDGTDTGSAVVSSSVTVVNTVPTLDAVSVSPSAPAIGDDLVATATGGDDIDGDAITYTYAWSVDGSEVFSESSTATTSTLDASYTAKGSSVTVSVTPSDTGGDGSAVASSAVTVVNSAPVATAVALDSTTPDTDDVITATVTASDADGDSLTFDWSWTVDGSEVFTETTSGASSSLDGSTYFDKGQVVVATATPHDGDESGTSASSASVTVVNAAPVLSSVALSSTDLTTTTDVSVSGYGYSDADGDAVTATYAWTVNGTAAGTGSTLSATEFAKDDVVQVTVTIDDGTDTDSLASSSVTVGNTAPTAAAAAIDPSSPTDLDDLLCDVTTAATDIDGDSLSYEIEWTVNGSDYTGSTSTTTWAGDTVAAAEVDAGDTWSCTVSAFDGDDYGPAADSADVSIGLGGTPPVGFAGTVGRVSGDAWTVCRADASTAWVAANSGGSYNAVEACAYLGYSGVDDWGGTCGTVCGYCGTSGAETYDRSGGSSPTSLSYTVHWRCTN